ncbi:MAG: DNA mismatch repair protein MutS [Cyclobacteriaceae bacterium]
MSRSKNKKNQEILDGYKKPKDEDYDFERIKLYFLNQDHSNYHQVISDRTCRDVDFEELFMTVDRTCSRIGQQYLYSTLRTIPKDSKRCDHFERIIQYFESNTKAKDKTILALHQLTEHGAYFLQRLIYGKNLTKPNWFWIIPFLSGLSMGLLILIFFYPVYPLFILILSVNFVIHFWNKNNLLIYSNTLPQLITMKNVAKGLTEHVEILEDRQQFKRSYEAINEIAKSAILLSWESRASNELGQIGEYFFELLKATFLLEPILIFRIINTLNKKKADINVLYHAIAKVDVAMSIASFRDSLTFCCRPIIAEHDGLLAKELFHPLIQDPIRNSINLEKSESVLISGSNMSGKTTFIRTIGINAILAQTINTACAKEFMIPKIKIHSAIRIADDLFNETSYYFEEVKVIKEMIDECETGSQNLFLLDELFKGTNTIERVASGKAVLSFLNQNENIVFASTHDLELTDYLTETFLFFHFEEVVDKGGLSFDFKLKSGKWINTNAIRILELNGYPNDITEEARKLANGFRKVESIDKK